MDVDDYVQVLEVCRDRGRALVGSLGGDAALIDVDDGSATALGRHEMGVLSAAWSSDGTEPAVASGHDRHIEDLAWDPSGRSVATGGGEGRTIVWATPTRAGQDLSPVTALESDAATSRVRWISEDSLLVGRADGGLVRLAL